MRLPRPWSCSQEHGLAPYEVLSFHRCRGMGEVYRGPTRGWIAASRRRFWRPPWRGTLTSAHGSPREAGARSALNHPQIVGMFGWLTVEAASDPPARRRLVSIRGASPLGLPYTRSRAPLRRRASASARSATARPRRSLGVGGPIAWLARTARSHLGVSVRFMRRLLGRPHDGFCCGARRR
jgi:hypothetical protein